jgi:hypothetical protein
MNLYTENGGPAPAPFRIYIGMRQVMKGATAYFTNFALDGEGIGGLIEYSILNELRTSVEAIRSAQHKLEAATPDQSGALADLDVAIAAHDRAMTKTDTALVDLALQRAGSGILTLKLLKASNKDFTSARAVLAGPDLKKAQGQMGKLNSLAGAELSAMANLLGWKAPNLKSLPPIFSLRIP